MQNQSITRCFHCRRYTSAARTKSFSSSSHLHALNPESPSWLPVPKIIQPPQPAPRPIKGILPIPKQVIFDRNTSYKATKKYLNQTASRPKQDNNTKLDLSQDGAFEKIYKKHVTATRRNLLHEGMQDLFTRRIEEAKSAQEDKKARQDANRKASQRAVLSDELYTEESIPEIVRDALAWIPRRREFTPKEKLEQRAQYDQVVETRVRRKMDAIHTLYLKARNFIVTPDQLNTEIENVFGADENPVVWDKDGDVGISVWKHGPPLSTHAMLRNEAGVWSDDLGPENEATRRRMIKLVGQLTGGEIPVDVSDMKRVALSQPPSE